MPEDAFTRSQRELGVALAALRAASGPQERASAVAVVMRVLGNLVTNAPTVELRDKWLAEYRRLQPDAATIQRLAADALAQSGGNQYFGPDWLLGPLDRFSSSVLTFGGQVLEGAGGAVAAAPGLVRASPWLILAALVVAGIVLVLVGPKLVPGLRARKAK